MTQADRRFISEMIGEFLREVGVLVFVFAPLDMWKGFSGTSSKFALFLLGTGVAAFLSLTMGILIERKRV